MSSHLLRHDRAADEVEGGLDWGVFTRWPSLYRAAQARSSVMLRASSVMLRSQGRGWIWMRSRTLACLNVPSHNYLVQNQGKASNYGVRNGTTQSLAEQTASASRADHTLRCGCDAWYSASPSRSTAQLRRPSSMWAITGKQSLQARRVGFWTVLGERGSEDGITGCRKWS